MAKQPTCDTPGCGRTIPKGGEGHPEICPTCLACLKMHNARPVPASPIDPKAGGSSSDVIRAATCSSATSRSGSLEEHETE